VPVWGALLALAWLGLLVRRARAARRQAPGPAHSVQLRTLTKAYGAPGKLRQEWARWERRARRLRLAGLDPVQLSGVRDSLWWKVPLLGLCGYLHTYFEDPLWLFLLAVATWRLTGHLAGCAALLWRGQRAPDAAPPARVLTVRRVVLGAAFLAYVHLRLKLLSVSVAAAAVWLAGVGLQVLVARVRSGKVQPQAIAGRLAWLRRGLYAGAVRTPVLGLRPPPFLALDGVDLEIGRGMFGLLGPNGAGKTTLLRLVSQVLSPTSGSVLIDGVNVSRSRSAQGSIGYLPQHFGLYDHLTAAEYLEYRALLEGFREPTERRQRVLACLEQVHLLERKDDRIGSYSGGMRQRVGIAQTLLHLPRIVIVDEPTAGLDPVERIRFRNLLARISQDRIVLFSTHIVEDIAGSCNRLAVLNRGKVVYAGTPEKMRALAAGQVWEAVLPPERFAALSAGLRLVTYRRTADGVFTRFLAAAPPAAVAARPVEPTLEDAYIHLLDDRREAAC